MVSIFFNFVFLLKVLNLGHIIFKICTEIICIITKFIILNVTSHVTLDLTLK
jgi:hypothetical protein